MGLSTPGAYSLGMIVRPSSGGTVAWMAPEIMGEKEISVGSDIWSSGMTAGIVQKFSPVTLLKSFRFLHGSFTRSRSFLGKPTMASVIYGTM